jgi:hypothetical protein
MNSPLAFAEAGFPIIPVQLEPKPNGGWRKQPMTAWSLATTEPAQIEGWWRAWPDALPGIPLARVGWAVVDADKHGGADGVAAVTGLGPLGPHSKIETPSGGLHLVFAQPAPPVRKFTWCPGVEILGEGCLLTCYDLEELKFPHVAPRAILPKMFWKPRDGEAVKRNLIKKPEPTSRPAALVADLTAALHKLDPRDWRDYAAWFALMTGACWVGISESDWIEWSTGDPDYAADGAIIRKMWRKLNPQHGGAFWAALSGAGIRIAKRGPLFNEVPSYCPSASFSPQPTRNLRRRLEAIQRSVERAPDKEDALFRAACTCAEIIAEGKLKPSDAMSLLVSAAKVNGLWREIGKDEVRRTIANGLTHVEQKLLAQPERRPSA